MCSHSQARLDNILEHWRNLKGVDSASLQFSVIENDRKEEREMPKVNVPTLNKGKGGSFWKPHTENLDINLQQNCRVDY